MEVLLETLPMLDRRRMAPRWGDRMLHRRVMLLLIPADEACPMVARREMDCRRKVKELRRKHRIVSSSLV